MCVGQLLRRPVLLVLLAALIAVLMPVAGQADFVFLKDGTILRGDVQREGVAYRDNPSGQDFWMAKIGGFYLVDDRTRKIIFSQRNVLAALPDPTEGEESKETFRLNHVLRNNPPRYLTAIQIDRTGGLDITGVRKITVSHGRGSKATTEDMDQCLIAITPHTVRASTRGHVWSCNYLANEFKREELLEVIRHHMEKKNEPSDLLERHFSVYRFCVQAGWLELAKAELEVIEKAFPDTKEKVADQQKKLRKLLAAHRAAEIELAAKAGQHRRLRKLLGEFSEEDAADEVKQKVASLRLRAQEADKNLKETRELFDLVRKQANGAQLPRSFSEAVAEIARDLNLDAFPRLEAFTRMAKQEERNRTQGRKPELTPDQLLALAISGWIMGNSGADSKVAVTDGLWQARQFVLDYLRTGEANSRLKMAEKYISSDHRRREDEITQLIELLPPPEADWQVKAEPFDAKARDGTAYRLLLPPEYHHHRGYPLLIVLPNVGEKPTEAANRYRMLAAQHGYLLAAVEWADLLQDSYKESEKEQRSVVEVLRDVRRRFQVDSERIFLAGFDESGKMAYDVGLSNPDLFAGVIVMCGRNGKHFSSYRCNAQYLPFYVVDGEKNGKNQVQYNREYENANRAVFRTWVPLGYPSIYVEYTGRGHEFFQGELPSIFEWMNHQKRAHGLPELGKVETSLARDFYSLRPSNNRFYWITLDENRTQSGARVAARIVESNVIGVRLQGTQRASLWLNTAMVDFEQPLEIRLLPPFGKTIKKNIGPDLKVLLEDFYLRGDKRNLFVDKVDLP